jgi:hypothetical protein
MKAEKKTKKQRLTRLAVCTVLVTKALRRAELCDRRTGMTSEHCAFGTAMRPKSGERAGVQKLLSTLSTSPRRPTEMGSARWGEVSVRSTSAGRVVNGVCSRLRRVLACGVC